MLYSQEEDSALSTHRLALTMLIKIVKSLGCAYGCGEGHRGLSGDRLRMQVSIVVWSFSKFQPVLVLQGSVL